MGAMTQTERLRTGHSAVPRRDNLALERENNELKARVAELERMVVRDTLTPLYNRRHFMAELDRWCWRALRYGGEFGLLFIDVDNLKAVNDGCGHAAGDAMLIAIAKALYNGIRKSDLVARIGGDEFAILLDNIPEEQLPVKARSLAQCVAEINITFDGHALSPSISAGHTVIEPGIKSTELLLRADRSMYAVKSAKGDHRCDK